MILLFLNNQLINALRIPSIIIIITRIRIQCNTLSIRVSPGAIHPSSLINFFKNFYFTFHLFNFHFLVFLTIFFNFFESMIEIESYFLQLLILTIQKNCI